MSGRSHPSTRSTLDGGVGDARKPHAGQVQIHCADWHAMWYTGIGQGPRVSSEDTHTAASRGRKEPELGAGAREDSVAIVALRLGFTFNESVDSLQGEADGAAESSDIHPEHPQLAAMICEVKGVQEWAAEVLAEAIR